MRASVCACVLLCLCLCVHVVCMCVCMYVCAQAMAAGDGGFSGVRKFCFAELRFWLRTRHWWYIYIETHIYSGIDS